MNPQSPANLLTKSQTSPFSVLSATQSEKDAREAMSKRMTVEIEEESKTKPTFAKEKGEPQVFEVPKDSAWNGPPPILHHIQGPIMSPGIQISKVNCGIRTSPKSLFMSVSN